MALDNFLRKILGILSGPHESLEGRLFRHIFISKISKAIWLSTSLQSFWKSGKIPLPLTYVKWKNFANSLATALSFKNSLFTLDFIHIKGLVRPIDELT